MLHYGQTTIAWLQVALGGSGLHTIMAGGPVGFSRQKKYLQVSQEEISPMSPNTLGAPYFSPSKTTRLEKERSLLTNSPRLSQ